MNDSKHRTKMRARRAPMEWDNVNINLYYMIHDGEKYRAAFEMEFVEMHTGSEFPSFASINQLQAQQLMDDLWECGLRPSEGSGSAGSMKAVQDHLKDFKTILWHTMKIEKGDK